MKLLSVAALLCMLLMRAEARIEDQIGQIIVSYIDGDKANESTFEFLHTHRPGGIILYNWSNILETPDQIKALCLGLQDQARAADLPPLFIAVDQEGGLKARLRTGFTEFPGNAALGRADSEELAYISAKEMGHEMMEVGINFTCAPVVDVNSNHDNPVIGIRSYGDDPDQVTKLGSAASRGFSDAGVISCLKHFPGHGDADIDSHLSLPVINKTRADLDEVELLPFRTILNHSPAIMTAHLKIPEIDERNPATLSKELLTTLLRNEWGYEGLIVTDSLTMGAICETCGDIGEAAVRAFEAGNDILLVGGKTGDGFRDSSHDQDLICVRDALINALRTGRISEQRLQQSLTRIAQTKKQFCIGSQKPLQKRASLAQESAQKIAEKSVRLEKGAYPSTLWDQRVILIAPQTLQTPIEESGLNQIGFEQKTLYFDPFNPTLGNIEKKLDNIDAVIFVSYNAWLFPKQEALLQHLSQKYPLILIASCDSRDAELDTSAQSIITTVSPTAVALRVVHDRITRAALQRDVPDDQIKKIGMRVWDNECHQRTDQLVFWNTGEHWPSVGIGHFIWPPESYNGIFREGRFHHVLSFLKEYGIELPPWLVNLRYSPWHSSEEFHAQKDSNQMKQLLSLLIATTPLQAKYMIERLWIAIPRLVHNLSSKERHHIIRQTKRILNTPDGLFALVDYLNFKHEGISPLEEYNGVRWGLKQVLLGMNDQHGPMEDMVISAKHCLCSRVAASPQKKREILWIPGWFARLERYLH